MCWRVLVVCRTERTGLAGRRGSSRGRFARGWGVLSVLKGRRFQVRLLSIAGILGGVDSRMKWRLGPVEAAVALSVTPAF
jgi:hypothetical protein